LDNQGAIQRLQSLNDSPSQSYLIRILKSAKKIIRKGASLEIIWVPGYKEILGNEKADFLAKEASTRAPLSTQTTSFAYLSQVVRKESLSQ
jgi:ribonuclease HI